MSSLLRYATIQIRRDTAGNWASENPTPHLGEWCLAVDTRELKIGDGSTAWNSLGGITLEVNGNVGIGTSSPQKDLHIESRVPTIRMSDENAGTDQAVATVIEFYRGNNTNRVGFLGMESASNNDLIIGTDYAAGRIVLATGSYVDALTIDSSQNVGIGTTNPTQPLSVKEKCCMTAIGGFAIKLTNKTGGNTVAGQLVLSSTGTNDAFATCGASSDACIGIILEAGVADGSEAWVVVSGIADVLMDSGGSARGDRIISSATAGSADIWNVGGAVATHFLEIGHCIETRAGAGLARCVIHFL